MYKVQQATQHFSEAAEFSGRAELWLPNPELSHCMRGIASRDTRWCTLLPEQMNNYFPASPMCSLLWYWQGDCAVAPVATDQPGQRQSVPKICLVGPHSYATVSWNSGPMYALILMLMPDAVVAMTGLDPGAFLDKIIPAEQVLPEPWWSMAQQIYDCADEELAVPLLEQFLNQQWQSKRPEQHPVARLYRDWSGNLALRAANSGLGRSLRQIERRIKSWTGQPLRELRGFSRSEQAFFDGVVATQEGKVNWTDIADENGYSDQSHLIRQTRRITGFAPEDLRQRILLDEGFWMYRLWGFSEGSVRQVKINQQKGA